MANRVRVAQMNEIQWRSVTTVNLIPRNKKLERKNTVLVGVVEVKR